MKFDVIAPKEERRGTMEDCIYCNKEKECYVLIPFTNCWEHKIDIYNGAHHSVCEECYNQHNKDGVLEELLYHERRIDIVKSQKYVRERHLFSIKHSVSTHNETYKVALMVHEQC